MKKNKLIWILFVGILFLAGLLRLWQLGQVPLSPDWDEAALGYNAYSILYTGKDEYGKAFPVILQSFNDYKPALYAYLIIPFITLGGLTLEMVRLPSALLGIVTVALTFLLVRKLFKSHNLALVSMFLLAISPWHIQFSRVAFEANVAVFFNISLVLCILYGIKKHWLLFIAPLFFTASVYTYQSEKVFAPLLALVLLTIYWKEIWAVSKKYLALSFVILIISLLPLISFAIHDKGAFARAQGVSIFAEGNPIVTTASKATFSDQVAGDKIGKILDNRRIALVKVVLDNYLSHFRLDWLFISGKNGRHRAPEMGLMYLFELPFLLIGIYQLLFGKYEKKTKQLIFAWLLLAPVPASVTTGVPHEVRILNVLPTLQILTAIGMMIFFSFIFKLKRFFKWGVLILIIGFMLFNFIYYLDQYFVQQNYTSAIDWRYGYKEIVAQTTHLDPIYSRVIVSNKGLMDQSYIFFLFYLQYPPEKYQKENKPLPDGNHAFGYYEFRFVDPTVYDCDPHTMAIGHFTEFQPTQKYTYMVHYPDGSPDIGIAAKNTKLCKKLLPQ